MNIVSNRILPPLRDALYRNSGYNFWDYLLNYNTNISCINTIL